MRAICGYHDDDGLYVKSNFDEVKRCVLELGANNDENDEGEKPLIVACGRRNTEIAGFLISEFSTEIDAKNYYSTTAFHQALMSGKMEIIDLLLQKGVRDPWVTLIRAALPMAPMSGRSGFLRSHSLIFLHH